MGAGAVHGQKKAERPGTASLLKMEYAPALPSRTLTWRPGLSFCRDQISVPSGNLNLTLAVAPRASPIFSHSSTVNFPVFSRLFNSCGDQPRRRASSEFDTPQYPVAISTIWRAGRFKNGVKSGNGNGYYRDGTLQYSGAWSSDTWSGQGTWYWENGQPYYKGAFANGQPNGFGTIHSESGTINYEGYCENGLRSGNGTSYDDAGIKNYQGDFLDNQRDGQGISYWPNGNVKYDGGWQAGTYSGEGKEYDENGNLLYEGIFDNGEFVSTSLVAQA